MINSNRKVVRKAFAALLTAELVGSGKPVQAVYDYPAGDFEGQSPVITVTSGSSDRKPFTFQGTIPTFDLFIDVFIVYAEAGWTEAQTEDALDDIELEIANIVAANQVTANWEALGMPERSQTTYVLIGGKEYRRELIKVRVE